VHIPPATAHRTDDPQTGPKKAEFEYIPPAAAAPKKAEFEYVTPAVVTSVKSTDPVDHSRYSSSEGQLIEAVLTRPSQAIGFGFGVASVWRIEGSVNVISFVDPNLSAARFLHVNDLVVRVNGRVR
jgi:hypothetical protein